MPIDPVYNPSLPSSSMNESAVSSSGLPAWSSRSIAPDSSAPWSSFAAGICAGAAIGAALALMYAPMRGNEFRSSLRRYANDGGDRLSTLLDSGRSIAGDALNRAASLIEQGRQALRTTRDGSSRSFSSSEPLTASVSEITAYDRRFEEPLGG
jgi:gas vesicle protein